MRIGERPGHVQARTGPSTSGARAIDGPSLNTPPAPSPPAPPPSPEPLASRARRGWTRGRVWRILRFGTGVAIGLTLAGTALTRGPVANWVIASLLAQHLGVEFHGGWTSLGYSGRLVLRDVSLRIPGVKGPEGEFLTAERIELSLDPPWRTLGQSGSAGMASRSRIELTRPLLRLSVGPGGRLNLLDISPPGGTSSRAPELPALVAINGLIEAGDHSEATYRPLATLAFNGDLRASDADPALYEFRLEEQRPEGMPESSAVKATGRFNLARGTAEARLDDVRLDDWTEKRVPEQVRLAWRQLGMRGELRGANLKVSRVAGVELDLRVAGMALTLPIEGDRRGVNEGRDLRMTGVTGSLRLRQGGRSAPEGSLQAELSGMVGDLPAEIMLASDGLDPITAGVRLQWWSRGFEVSRNPELAPYLPPLVRKRLTQFSGPTAVVDAFVSVERPRTIRPPIGPPAPAPLAIRGSVQFTNGQAAFDQFPYPFFDVSGRITFDDRDIRITDVTGRGLTGARLLATGRTWPTDDPVEVDLNIDVTDAPIDSLLASAADRRVGIGAAVLANVRPEQIVDLRAGRPVIPPDTDPLLHVMGEEKLTAARDAEDSWRAGLFQALFSEKKLQVLRDQGMVLTPDERELVEEQLAGLRAERHAMVGTTPADQAALAILDQRERELVTSLGKPVFSFGGTINHLNVRVSRNPQLKHYNAYVRADFPLAGIVPNGFPLPLYARSLALDILEDDLMIRATVGRGIQGGLAEVDGHIDLRRLKETGGVPTLNIHARDLLIDNVLIRAIPIRKGGNTGGPTAREMLEALNLRGLVDCEVKLWPDERNPRDVAADVDITLKDLAARPASSDPAAPPLLLGGLTGSVRVDSSAVRIEGLKGRLWPGESIAALEARQRDLVGPLTLDASDDSTSEGQGGNSPAAVSLEATVPTSSLPGAPPVKALIGVKGLDLATRLEDLITPISPAAAKQVARLRSQRSPSGLLDAGCDLTIDPPAQPGADSPVDMRFTLDRSRNLTVAALDGRLAIAQRSGTAKARVRTAPGSADEPAVEATFDHLDLALTHDGKEVADLVLDGPLSVPTLEADGAQKVTVPSPLGVTIRSARLDSPVALALMGTLIDPAARDWAKEHKLRGRFAGDLTIAPQGPDGPIGVSGTIDPEWLGLDRGGTALDARPVHGRLVLSPGRIQIDGLRIETPQWSLRTQGEFTLPHSAPQPAPWSMNLRLEAAASRVDESLLATLPDAAAAALRESQAQTAGGLRLTRGDLTLVGNLESDAGIGRGVFDGQIDFIGLSMDAGLSLSDANGTLAVRAEIPADGSPAQVTLGIDAASLRVADLTVASVRAVAHSGGLDDSILIEPIEGELYGGRVAGRAVIRPGEGSTGPRRFESGLRLAGVRFADVLAELDRAAEQRRLLTFVGPPTPEEIERLEQGQPRAGDLPPVAVGDASRGRLDAEFSLAGLAGQPLSRRGRGSLRIAGGDVIRLPLIMPMMQLSNLGLPLGDRLDFAQASFVLDGNRLDFDQIALLADSLSVLGWGTVTLPDYTLDLRFNSRGVAQLPLLSGLFEGLRNELITTTVAGTIDDPRIATEQFSGTRRLIDTILGRRATVLMPDFSRLDAAARADRDRAAGG
jgi:hypothetical protein